MSFNPLNPYGYSIQDSSYRKNVGEGSLRPVSHGVSAVKNWLGSRNAPQIGQNPYLGDWNSLIAQLQQQASGQGPSLAGNAYNQAHAQGLRDQRSMAAGGSAGRARQAGLNMTRMNQGLAAGYSNARLQEQLAARQSLQAALSGAGNAWFMPQQANLQSQLATPTGLQQLTNFASQLAGGAGMLGIGRGGGGGGQWSYGNSGPPGGGGGYTWVPG